MDYLGRGYQRMIMPLDTPKLWVPPKPAIVRAASLKELRRLRPPILGMAGAAAASSLYSGRSPGVLDKVASNFASNTTASVPLPGGIQSGDALLALWVDNQGRGATTPTGWTSLMQSGDGQFNGHAHYRICDGSEGSTQTFTWGGSAITAWIVLLVTGITGVFEAGTPASSDDPPSLSPSWGSATILVVAAAFDAGASSPTYTGFPSGYPDTLTSIHSGNCGVAAAWKTITASSEDPGAFTQTGATRKRANTFAIRLV